MHYAFLLLTRSIYLLQVLHLLSEILYIAAHVQFEESATERKFIFQSTIIILINF